MFSLVLKPLTYFLTPATVNAAHPRNRTGLLVLCLPVIGSLIACDSGEKNTATGELIAGELSLNVPSRIRNINAINPNAVRAIATVNDTQYPLTRADDGRYQTSVNVDANMDISVSVSFSETLSGGTNLNLASHPAIDSNTGNDDLTLQFFDDNYETEGFDLDGDGCSNIVEREVLTNPLVNDAIPANFVRTVSFNIPPSITNLPDQQLVQTRVLISGIGRAVRRIDTSIQSSGALTQCSNAEIQVLLNYNSNNGSVAIASAGVTHNTTANVVLSESDFDFNEDADGDGLTNLTELQNGTDPLVAN